MICFCRAQTLVKSGLGDKEGAFFRILVTSLMVMSWSISGQDRACRSGLLVD